MRRSRDAESAGTATCSSGDCLFKCSIKLHVCLDEVIISVSRGNLGSKDTGRGKQSGF